MKQNANKLLASEKALDALTRLGQSLPKNHPVLNLHLPSIDKIGQDGVDHINTSVEATNLLGKIFSMYHPMGFHEPITNRRCESLYHWNNFINDKGLNPKFLTISSNSTNLKTARNEKLQVYQPLLLAWGLYQKVSQNNDLRQVMKEVAVPFDCYVTLETKTRTRACRNYIAALQVAQRAIVRETYPQLWRLLPPEDALAPGKSSEEKFKDVIAIIYNLLESAIYRQDEPRKTQTNVDKGAEVQPQQDTTSLETALPEAENPQPSLTSESDLQALQQAPQELKPILDGEFTIYKPTEQLVNAVEETTENQTGVNAT